ncbi:hypothetical protein YB04_003023 [Salmonella enterica subsp. enterica]|uniref:Uncharacterized protein n=1 Tax=Salmonella enterica subsp. enterica serovar Lattenkamp TaxID=2564671 RepID=A0A734FVI7_SALET|nr:hypothetical protein [Salmonella enterica subsp. enterica]EDV3563891.1 hypothetical protein [Salmonella enterica subsp. enterica]HAE6196214.1 hypothetical protein [Salmonella enterica subsp. enterica serovar Lattenkamp]HAE6921366.1 hypothetical protein [Salmonella enterica subsp. enterica serovar Lattenkamp]
MRKYPRKITQSLASRCKALHVPFLSHYRVKNNRTVFSIKPGRSSRCMMI